ncbi:MAG: pectin acetylesterase-family hydrolase [Byssovorax sp.]
MRFRIAASAVGLVLGAACGGTERAPSGGAGGAGGTITGAGGGGDTTSSAVTTTSSSGGPTTTSSGGTGGMAPSCPPKPPLDGVPVSAPDGQWTWIDVAGAKCRDGSPTGFGIRKRAGSKRLYIYLEGGGACFNGDTCTISLAAFGKGAFDAWASSVGNTGVFNAGNADNPVKDWNAVYVPYCTADIHGGDAPDTNVPLEPAFQHQDFVGYENVGLYLRRLVPTFPDLEQVLLTGISAGGFGAAYNYDRVATAFCPTQVALIDDSGPPMSDTYLAPCLQKKWKTLWDLDKTLPAGCPACIGPDGGGIVNYVPYLQQRWPDAPMGLISATHDSVISAFFGYGSQGCTASTPLSAATYEAGLADLRDNYLAASPRWGTYYIDSSSHTWLLGPGFYTTTVKGKRLVDWFGDVLHGAPSHIAP